MCTRKVIRYLGFSHREVFIGEEEALEVDQGAYTTGRRRLGVGHAPWWCGHPLVQPHLLFGVLEAP
jgi:hypothetical protein